MRMHSLFYIDLNQILHFVKVERRTSVESDGILKIDKVGIFIE